MASGSSGLARLTADLEAAPLKAAVGVGHLLDDAGARVQAGAQRRISGHPHSPAYPSSITHDTTVGGGGMAFTTEIGPDKDRRQGALGNILEFGTSKNAPIPHLAPALDEEEPKLEGLIGDFIERLI